MGYVALGLAEKGVVLRRLGTRSFVLENYPTYCMYCRKDASYAVALKPIR